MSGPGGLHLESADRGRWHSWLNFRQDAFFKLHEWPMWAQQAILADHKSFRDRYNLLVFLILNGLDPETAVDWVRTKGVALDGRFIYGTYSGETLDDMESVARRVADGSLPRGKHVYDMYTMKVVYHT